MRALCFAVAVMAIQLCLSACGASAIDNAQVALVATSRAVVAADETVAPAYTERAQVALDVAERAVREGGLSSDQGWARYRSGMRELDAVESALRFARQALLAAQDALDAWRAADDGGRFSAAVPCVTASLRGLDEAMREIELAPPPEIGQAIELVASYGGTCRPREPTIEASS